MALLTESKIKQPAVLYNFYFPYLHDPGRMGHTTVM